MEKRQSSRLYLAFCSRVPRPPKLHNYNSMGIPYNVYTFGCKLLKRTFLEEQRNFSAVSRLIIEGFFLNFTHITLCACSTIGISLVEIDQWRRALCCRTKNFLGFNATYIRGLFTKPLTKYYAPALHLVQVWLRSVNNEGHLLVEQRIFSAVSRLLFMGFFRNYTSITRCACTVIYINVIPLFKNLRALHKKNREPCRLYLALYPWAFSKTQTYHSQLMPYIWFKFGCERSVKKGTLLWEQLTF